MKNRTKIFVLAILIILLNIGCDQGTKEYARKNFKHKGTIKVLDNFFILRYVENTGGFLSMGSNIPQPYKNILLTIFPIVMLTGLAIFIIVNRKLSVLQIICLSCILGGGISNIFDRIVYNGLVTDFMNFGIGNIRTGILNFADLSITFGVIFLVINKYVQEKKIKKTFHLTIQS